MNRPRPLNKRRQVQFMIVLTILAWATQTLMHQWGFGAETRAARGERAAENASSQELSQPAAEAAGSSDGTEKFVPVDRASHGATIELRSEATIVGGEIKLKQICRWTSADNASVEPIGELVLARVGESAPFKALSVDEIKSTLHDAGVNLAAINFVGATSCTVNRSDVQYDERVALQQWIDAKQGKPAAAAESRAASTAPTEAPADAIVASSTSGTKASDAGDKQFHSLRDLLSTELSQRLNLSADTIQLTFRPQDEKALNLAEPHFKFQIEPLRGQTLGNIAWTVTLVSDGVAAPQRMHVSATARAWQTQLIANRPLATKQIIQETDVTERRVLVDIISDDPLVTRQQAVGQQAARDIKPGAILTARMLDPVLLIKPGQLVSILVSQGNVQIKTVARALDGGSLGQTVKVRNETTKDTFDVTVTGAQTASLTAAPPGQTKVASSGGAVGAE